MQNSIFDRVENIQDMLKYSESPASELGNSPLQESTLASVGRYVLQKRDCVKVVKKCGWNPLIFSYG